MNLICEGGWQLDKETGLYNYGARYYDPSLSIWTGVDPLADKFPGWGPYNYTMNNPINMIDPDGRSPDWIDNGDGTWTAEAGDSAYSLSEDAGISPGYANYLVEDQHGENYRGNDGQMKSNIHKGEKVRVLPGVDWSENPSSNSVKRPKIDLQNINSNIIVDLMSASIEEKKKGDNSDLYNIISEGSFRSMKPLDNISGSTIGGNMWRTTAKHNNFLYEISITALFEDNNLSGMGTGYIHRRVHYGYKAHQKDLYGFYLATPRANTNNNHLLSITTDGNPNAATNIMELYKELKSK